jgi:hypothetical protein
MMMLVGVDSVAHANSGCTGTLGCFGFEQSPFIIGMKLPREQLFSNPEGAVFGS